MLTRSATSDVHTHIHTQENEEREKNLYKNKIVFSLHTIHNKFYIFNAYEIK